MEETRKEHQSVKNGDDLALDHKGESKKKKSSKHKHKHKHKKHRHRSSSEQGFAGKESMERPEDSGVALKNSKIEEEEDDDTYGPVAPFSHSRAALDPNYMNGLAKYGDNLLAGEGTALAEYIRKNERIPRRGEVGLDGEKIKQFEELGYVMSGSRNKRMEAVRKRKENQIFSAEEKRLLVINETKKREEKEAKVLEDLRHLIKKKEYENAT